MVETCAKRQPVPLKNDNPRIQDQDSWVIILNARRLTAFWCTFFLFINFTERIIVIHAQSQLTMVKLEVRNEVGDDETNN